MSRKLENRTDASLMGISGRSLGAWLAGIPGCRVTRALLPTIQIDYRVFISLVDSFDKSFAGRSKIVSNHAPK
jgi:hypothetical protein